MSFFDEINDVAIVDTFVLACWYNFIISRSSSNIKVIGSRSRSQEQRVKQV